MKKFLKTDEWSIIEEEFNPTRIRESESIFSLGNGRFGQRGFFEETYSSDSLPGSYVAGVSFLDRTKVGWWKNGYPHYFSRIPNAPNWCGLYVRLIDEEVDLAVWDVNKFERKLDMKAGILYRDFEITSPKGNKLRIHVEHINSMDNQNISAIKYSVTSINYEGKISIVPYLNSDIKHESSNFNDRMWDTLRAETNREYAYVWVQTKRRDTQVCCAFTYQFFKNSKEITTSPIKIEKEKLTGFSIGADVKPSERVTLIKYISIISSLYCDRSEIVENTISESKKAKNQGWEILINDHCKKWEEIWQTADVEIEGDLEAQQGIRFNIYQLNQSYRGDDPRLNIGPKGFTGEKYGGNTQWNTELCCVPYFLLSSSKETAKNLLLYRYNQLPKAIENATKLGFKDGAALYPMVTFYGEECHNEWEITFEEIHRNNIIAYAITQFAAMTGDDSFIAKYGLEMMIAICRFWAQRISFSSLKQKYVILGVTGPNEYENNVDNNWYTNYSCIQTLKDTILYINKVAQKYPEEYQRICKDTKFSQHETELWEKMIDGMYLPIDEKTNIFIQHDGYLDKELKTVDDIPKNELPINQHWSWDRILRSCYIKQSDVLLGIYLYYPHFNIDSIKSNFNFYEPRTLHESSLSPYVHSILAARIGDIDKAYNLLLHATRLDLDDYNNELSEGLHITSMPGSWLAIVQGLAGMQIENNMLSFKPTLPLKWNSYTFNLNYRKRVLKINIKKRLINIRLLEGDELNINIYNTVYSISKGKETCIEVD